MKTLKDLSVKNKRVLVRCDFNVPLNEQGVIEDDSRVKKAIPTIEYLLKNGAKVILISHLGDPKGEFRPELRLDPIQKKLSQLLGFSIKKVDDCVGREVEEMTADLKEGEILLLENLRFHKGEEENDSEFAKQLAKLGDFFVNDAFSVCHRAHASVALLPKLLPSSAGLLLENEFKMLNRVMVNPERPLVSVLGGAKIEDKIKVIDGLLKKSDHLLIGGKIANTLLEIKGVLDGRILPPANLTTEIKNIDIFSVKLHLPLDVVVSRDSEGTSVRNSAVAAVKDQELLLDIGEETIDMFSKIIETAKTIIWAGPLGLFEKTPFEQGTRKIAEAIAENKNALKIAGGGDTIFALDKFNLASQFDHISTGGGAMLDFLAGEEMPGLKALE